MAAISNRNGAFVTPATGALHVEQSGEIAPARG